MRSRDVADSDLPIFFVQQMDQDAAEMAEFPSRDHDAYYAHVNKILQDEKCILLTILWNDKVAGNIGSYDLFGEREVTYWLGKEYWGKGIATAALTEFLEIEMTRPVEGRVAKGNIGSRRVLEKCWFVVTGEDEYENPGGVKVQEYVLRLD